MGLLSWFFEIFTSPSEKLPSATLVDHRIAGGQAAIVLIHGFSGDTKATWAGLLGHLIQDQRIATWDIIGLGFPSSLRIDVPNVWTADPGLSIIAQSLTTTLSLPPLRDYRALAIVAHSMGGLVAQRAILDDPDLEKRVTQLLIFGTPSGGLPKARIFSQLKRQFRDMSPKSAFITDLRHDWKKRYRRKVPFEFRAIAGERDEFVPPSSSLVPFRAEEQAVVPGNHLEIVKPISSQHQSVTLLIDALTGRNRPLPPIDSAKLAVELGQFKQAIAALLPNVNQLDDNAIVSLALALESTKQGQQALNLLEKHHRGGVSSTDAIGTLAGRLKRRWLISRTALDYDRALELYGIGLSQAEQQKDYAQAFYHAINVAFLSLMKLPPNSAVTSDCMDLATRALKFCELCPPSQWRLATEGEAYLILGRLPEALACYDQAIKSTNSQREIESMYAQAFRVSERIFGEEGIKKIEDVFALRK